VSLRQYSYYYCNVVDDLSEIAVKDLTGVIRAAMEQAWTECCHTYDQYASDHDYEEYPAPALIELLSPYCALPSPTQQPHGSL